MVSSGDSTLKGRTEKIAAPFLAGEAAFIYQMLTNEPMAGSSRAI